MEQSRWRNWGYSTVGWWLGRWTSGRWFLQTTEVNNQIEHATINIFYLLFVFELLNLLLFHYTMKNCIFCVVTNAYSLQSWIREGQICTNENRVKPQQRSFSISICIIHEYLQLNIYKSNCFESQFILEKRVNEPTDNYCNIYWYCDIDTRVHL